MTHIESDERFARRKERWSRHKRVENGKQPAGAPMYYYCHSCGAEIVLPEAHIEPAPKYCDECIEDGVPAAGRELLARFKRMQDEYNEMVEMVKRAQGQTDYLLSHMRSIYERVQTERNGGKKATMR